MVKIKKLISIFIIFICFNIGAEETILVKISEQRLYLIDNNKIIISFPISSSFYGEGQEENSYKTPLGKHTIKEKIGSNAIQGTIFKSRINTENIAQLVKDHIDTEDDHVTSRIMCLEGEEEGFNRGGKVDSYNRYIYIHGTHEEGLIGSKASHGCIRMFNNDVIELFNRVNIGTKVYIKS